MSCKKSPSVWYEILRLFVNALTADDKYSGSNMQNLQQQLSAIISESKEIDFLLHYAWNLEPFQEKDEYPSLIISEIKRRGYLNV